MSIMLQLVLKDDEKAMEMLVALQRYHLVAYPVPRKDEFGPLPDSGSNPSYKVAQVKTIYRSQ